MHSSTSRQLQAAPRRRRKRDRDDESIDAAPQLLEDEPGDIEQANPAENESIDEIEDAEERPSRIFDDGPPDRDEPHE